MSDFLFSQKPVKKSKLAKLLKDVYPEEVKVKEFHGSWGSLALVRNQYHGFKPLETDKYLMFVIGGPVLTFRDNQFLVETNSTKATKSIFERWIKQQEIDFSSDLSGPFVLGLIDKSSGELTTVTDLMSFIPVFHFKDKQNRILGTHVDTVAQAANDQQNFDLVSIAEFVHSRRITFPFTIYKQISQLLPSTVTSVFNNKVEAKSYWLPAEKNSFDSIDQAASELRSRHLEYLDNLPLSGQEVSLLTSGGQDSRVVLASLPKDCRKRGVIFLDQMNREGRIAQKAAKIYHADFEVYLRSKTYYLDIFSKAINLVGSSSVFSAHSLGVYQNADLDESPFVLGGYLADTYLKYYFFQVQNHKKFIIEITNADWLTQEVEEEINHRRQSYFQQLRRIRPTTTKEWFYFYPTSMLTTNAHFDCNRRLFRIYEVFFAAEIIKLAAAVPQRWKLKKRMFTKAYKPLLKKSWYLPHTYGWFPYFSSHINSFANLPIQFYLKFLRVTGIEKNQGPWFDWSYVKNHEKVYQLAEKFQSGFDPLKQIFTKKYKSLLTADLTDRERFNLLQICHLVQKQQRTKA